MVTSIFRLKLEKPLIKESINHFFLNKIKKWVNEK